MTFKGTIRLNMSINRNIRVVELIDKTESNKKREKERKGKKKIVIKAFVCIR